MNGRLDDVVDQPRNVASSLRLPLLQAERRYLLLAFDVFALNTALLLSLTVRSFFLVPAPIVTLRLRWFLLLSAAWVLIAYALDAYDASAGKYRSAVKAGLVTSVVYMFIPYLTPAIPPSRVVLLAFPAFVVASLLASRGLYWRLFASPVFQRRTLIVGGGWAGRIIAAAICENAAKSYSVVGFVDDARDKQGEVIVNNESARPLRVLGSRDDIARLIQDRQITTVVLAVTNEIDDGLLQILMDALEAGVEVVPMPVLHEQLTGRIPIEHVGAHWQAAMPIVHAGHGSLARFVKRGSDIVLAFLGLVALAMVLPLLAAAIYVESRGPVFYSQSRVGRGGRLFKAYKLRSMVLDAERDGPLWSQRNDSRITRVGRVLRRTHLDELPQLLNVLKGEMSLVGPRPERPEFAKELATEIPFYNVRHAVKPGMTGWGQVRQGYTGSKADAFVKLQYDLYYIKHQSIWLDGVILLKTIVHTITLGGR